MPCTPLVAVGNHSCWQLFYHLEKNGSRLWTKMFSNKGKNLNRFKCKINENHLFFISLVQILSLWNQNQVYFSWFYTLITEPGTIELAAFETDFVRYAILSHLTEEEFKNLVGIEIMVVTHEIATKRVILSYPPSCLCLYGFTWMLNVISLLHRHILSTTIPYTRMIWFYQFW